MAYNIIDVATGTLVRGLEYPTAAEATAAAKAHAAEHGGKFKIKVAPIDDSQWIAREQTRMNDGTYVAVPFAGTIWAMCGNGRYTAKDMKQYGYDHFVPLIGTTKTHFAHVSMTNKTMLAYTESSEKGVKDIQTQIKPGAYLTKYFGSVISPEEIAHTVRDWQLRFANAELKFARDPKEIVRIYQGRNGGPRSCMSGNADEYSGHGKHPCEVYGQPHSDLTLAYLESKKSIISRCIVWEEKKQYGRIYGDRTLIERELKELGYTPGCFEGAKVGKFKVGTKSRAFVMPYIDGWSRVIEKDDHFLLSNGAGLERDKLKWHCCSNTNGITQEAATYTCEGCDDEFDDDQIHHIPRHGYYCRLCYGETFIYCDHIHEYELREGSEIVVTRYAGNYPHGHWREEIWCERAVQDDAFYCELEHAWFANTLQVLHEGEAISQRAYDRINPPEPQLPVQPPTITSTYDIQSLDWATPTAFANDISLYPATTDQAPTPTAPRRR